MNETRSAADGDTGAGPEGVPPLNAMLFHNLSNAHVVGLAESAAWERARLLPVWRTAELPVRWEADQLIPPGSRVVLDYRSEGRTVLTAEGDGHVVLVTSRHEATDLFIAARTAVVADEFIDWAKSRVEVPPSDTTAFSLWRHENGQAISWTRDLQVPAWSDIAQNYPDRVGLDDLMALDSLEGSGRLVLWTGPPGTGKTFAIRALAKSWSPWCSAHLIIDPERFFGDVGYLISVLTGSHHNFFDADDEKKARLIICEDADDFIRAREEAGPGLGRLLNVGDGLLGQGLSTVILLTSNTPVERLDPALVRPGRLLANLEFGRFTVEQARRWLGDPVAPIPRQGATLAELYELAGGTSRRVSAPRAPEPNAGYL